MMMMMMMSVCMVSTFILCERKEEDWGGNKVCWHGKSNPSFVHGNVIPVFWLHKMKSTEKGVANKTSTRLNFRMHEASFTVHPTVMVPATSTQLIIESTPLVTRLIHLGACSPVLQPIIGSFNNTRGNIGPQPTVSRRKGGIIQGIQLPI